MQVVLLERIQRLGQMGDVVTVRPGYARNFLFPRKKALRATKENIETFERQRHQLEAANLELRNEASAIAERLDGLVIGVIRQASEGGQLYGSVSARDIAEGITTAGFTVDRGQVRLDRAIKTLGLHPVRVTLHPEVETSVTVNVALSEDEAQRQLERSRAPEASEPGGAAAEAQAAAEAALALADDDSVLEAAKALTEEPGEKEPESVT